MDVWGAEGGKIAPAEALGSQGWGESFRFAWLPQASWPFAGAGPESGGGGELGGWGGLEGEELGGVEAVPARDVRLKQVAEFVEIRRPAESVEEFHGLELEFVPGLLRDAGAEVELVKPLTKLILRKQKLQAL